jgi:peptidoglycan/LPS O-acetylase OafA/YrhL
VRRHDLDPTSLVAGLVFLSFALFFVIDGAGWADVDARWFGPLVLLGLGSAGLIAAARGSD